MSDEMDIGTSPTIDRTAREHVARVRRVLWSDQDTLAVLLLIESADGVEHTAIGDKEASFFSSNNTQYRFHGRWEDNPRGGYRFRFATVVVDKPLNKAGVVKYLTDIAPNVGRVTAEKLFARYGADAVEVLRTSPGRVSEDGIMGFDAAKEAARELEQHKKLEGTQIELFGLFAGYGFHGKAIDACIRLWGAGAGDEISKDPFQLLIKKIPSAGFKRCDKLYCSLGLPRDAMSRQMVCAWNQVRQDSDGHTWHLATEIGDRLREQIPRADPVAAFKAAKEIDWLRFRRDEQGVLWVAETKKATAEERVASNIMRLLNAKG
jgi:exodeoxyribonuclease V alpha subunit